MAGGQGFAAGRARRIQSSLASVVRINLTWVVPCGRYHVQFQRLSADKNALSPFPSNPVAPSRPAVKADVMRVSIVVLNYNYARFVAQAIESALAQTCAGVEVVVVDNGSTDESLSVIARYADRVRLVRQPVNIGQGQGYNLGFEAARGDWIVWLDADDLLDPEAMATCLALVDDQTAKVQFALRHIGAEGELLGGITPFLRHAGDVVPLIRRFGHYAGPPGSGNLYRRLAIAPYFPVDPADWPIGTDTVPFITAPFHGRVVDAGPPLGSYRLHQRAASNTPGYTGNYAISMAGEVRLNVGSRDKCLALLRERSGIDVAEPPLTLPSLVRHRILSWRWAPAEHPFPDDRAGPLWHLLRRSLCACPGYTLLGRTLMLLWAAGVLLLPLRMAGALMAIDTLRHRWKALTHRAGPASEPGRIGVRGRHAH